MDFANIQAQLANLTSQLSQIAERTTMQSVPTFGVSYGHGYPTHQRPQFTANGDAWGYQDYDQPSNNMFSNTYNSDWSDHSNYTWGEPQQVQHEGYWQPYEELYSTPMQPPQPPPQSSQPNPGSSMDNDTVIKLLTSLSQGQENQDKKVDELENQIGQIMEFMAQIQEQSELSNSTIENSKEDFEIHDAITLGSAMEVGADLKTSKHSLRVDEELLIEEEVEDTPLPQAPSASKLSIQGKLGSNSVISNPIPPNVPFPRRFFIPKEKESEKDIVEALPKVPSDIPICGTTNQVSKCVEFLEEKEVAGEYKEFIKEDVVETTIPKEVAFDDTGQVTTIIVNLAKCKVPETFKDVVFVIEFLSNKASKPSSPISNSFSINMVLILMIQAPTLEFKPLPDHFKYHLPFKDQLQAVGSNGK